MSAPTRSPPVGMSAPTEMGRRSISGAAEVANLRTVNSPGSADPVATLAAGLLSRVDALADELADRIGARIEFYRDTDVVGRAELIGSLARNIAHILGDLVSARSSDHATPRRIGRDRAAQGVPLDAVLRAYRVGFAFVWEQLLREARAAGEAATDALLDSSTRVWELSDDFAMAMNDAYRDAMHEQLIAADRRRSGIVSTILVGSGEHSAWEVAKLLDLPFQGSFLVIVVESSPPAPGPSLEDRLRRCDVTSVWRPQPDHEIGLLSVGARRDPASVIDELSRAASGRIGVSPVFDRLDGAARALRLAQVGMESLPGGSSAVRQFEDDPLIDLLVKDRDTTRAFVDRVLGTILALAGDDRVTMLATATAWIDAKGSAAEAGRVLYCHENTVRYRIRRLEEHLGESLNDPRQLADLATALRAIRVFPEFADPQVEP